MATRVRKHPSSKYRIICDDCGGHGYYLPMRAKSWESAEDCPTCKGEGELCQHCGEPVPDTDPPTPHGCVGPADPCDVMALTGYFSNLPRYEIDEVWTRNGNVYVQVSSRIRMAECPPDATIYRYEIVERCVRGEDVETVKLTEIGWVSGTSGLTTWNDDSEQAYPESRR